MTATILPLLTANLPLKKEPLQALPGFSVHRSVLSLTTCLKSDLAVSYKLALALFFIS